MGIVVNFSSWVHQKAAERAYRLWRSLFGETVCLHAGTSWKDLPDTVLLFFCRESARSKLALYDFLMGALGLGYGYELESQPPEDLSHLLNAYFYFSDQARFECCRRIEWTEPMASATRPLIEQVLDPSVYDYPNLMQTPVPTPHHPAHEAYQAASGLEKNVLMRRWLPEAVKRFEGLVIAADAQGTSLPKGDSKHDKDCYDRHCRPCRPRQDDSGAPLNRR